MGTNMIEMAAQHIDAPPVIANGQTAKSEPEGRGGAQAPSADRGSLLEAGQELALAPLVDTIAQGLARVLVVAVRELENHIASEARKVGDSVGRRLDTLQSGFQDLTDAVSEQRSLTLSVQGQCQQLAAAAAALQESDARQDAKLAAVRSEAAEFSKSVAERIDALSKELGVQQEDIAAVQSTLTGFYSRIDALTERFDKQAATLRSLCTTYAQRETELEQLVDGLARLRAYPAPAPANGL